VELPTADLPSGRWGRVSYWGGSRPDSFLSLRATPTGSRRGAKSVRGARVSSPERSARESQCRRSRSAPSGAANDRPYPERVRSQSRGSRSAPSVAWHHRCYPAGVAWRAPGGCRNPFRVGKWRRLSYLGVRSATALGLNSFGVRAHPAGL